MEDVSLILRNRAKEKSELFILIRFACDVFRAQTLDVGGIRVTTVYVYRSSTFSQPIYMSHWPHYTLTCTVHTFTE